MFSQIDNKTLVMFSSDNGATFTDGADTRFFESQGILRGTKMDLYEGGIRIPFIAKWPGKIKPGSVNRHISTRYDIMATLAELTGASLLQTDGISFLPQLFGHHTMQQKHPCLYFEYPEKGGQVAVRMGDWKGIKTGSFCAPSTTRSIPGMIPE